jgi:hypothetical protein
VDPLVQLEADAGDPRYRNESNFETSKTDGFADDNSTGTLCEYRSLSKLKEVLTDFATISGLKCNTDKSVIMQVGNKIPVSQEIIDLGFAFDDKIKILGMEIDSELEHLDNNFSNALVSIKKSINFWEKLNLSLQGRINVAKSILFSQIIYLGSILMPSRQRINDLQNSLDDFVKGNLNFAKNRITLPVTDGGLGMFNVEEFLTAQQCVWILRAHKSTRDNWRVKLRQLCNGNLLTAGPNLIDPVANPILHGLSCSFEKLRVVHDSKNENYIKALIFNNPLFFRGRGDKNTLNATYLGLNEGQCTTVANMTAIEFFDTNGIKSLNDLSRLHGLELREVGYERLTKCLNHFVSRIKYSKNNDGSKKTLISTFGKIKKPGPKIRECLIKKRKKSFELVKQTQSVSFSRITLTDLPSCEVLSDVTSLWSKNGLNTRVKTFIFKFYNNLLGLNTRVSHFANTVDRGCTLCKINRSPPNALVPAPAAVPLPYPDENFKHMFLDCPTVRKLHDQFLNKYFTSVTFNNDLDRAKFFFYGTVPGFNNYNVFIHGTVLIFQYAIWQMKLKKRILSFESNSIILMENLLCFFNNNKEARKKSLELNFSLCRSINRLPVLHPAPGVPLQARPPAAAPPPAFNVAPPAPGIPPAPPWRH